LDAICKSYERNKKIEKEKKKRKKIYKWTPGTQFGPAKDPARSPGKQTEPVLSFPLFLSLTPGPTCQLTRSSPSSGPNYSPETELLPPLILPSIPP
jgi:hypothetical protein